MATRLEVYKCTKCGIITEVLFAGVGTLACCGQDMHLMKEGTTDASLEKHVPVIEKTANGYKVKVGSDAHPMTEEHWITWIELIADDISYTKFLNPGDAPEAEFCVKADKVSAREHCNLHGHWKSDN